MTLGNVEAALVLEPILRDQGEISKKRPLQLRSWSLWYLYWQVLICVFVFVLKARHILFLVDFESTCLVHASLTFDVCLFFLYFLFAFADCMIAFSFYKRPGPLNGRKHFCKAWHICVRVCFCIICLPLQIACLLLSFCKRPMGENIFAMLDKTFSAPFHKNTAFTTQYNWCMKYHQ